MFISYMVGRYLICEPRRNQMLQFQVGDKAVYPAQGVAEIVGIEQKEIAGRIQHFYCLRIVDTDMKILVPVDKAQHVGLRKLVTDGQIKEVYRILKDRDVHIDKQTWNRRYRGFMEKIKTGSIFEVAEVFRDLYRLKNTKTLSFGERRMLDTAKNLMVKELSIAQSISTTIIESELETLFVSTPTTA